MANPALKSRFSPEYYLAWEAEPVEDLLQSRGIKVLHVYPARADSTNGFYEYRDGHFYIQQGFEAALLRQSRLRDEGRLELSSVKDYFSYQLAIKKLKISLLANGVIQVENKSDIDLKAVSFAINSATVKVPGKTLGTRNENGETFFWFDLNKGERIIIEISPTAK